MKREFIIGGLLGMGFGLLGLLFIAFLLTEGQFDYNTIFSDDGISIMSFGLFFSFLFGGLLAKRISEKKSMPIPYGILSSALTTICTVIVVYIVGGISIERDVQSVLAMILVALLYSFILGGIPMLILGSLFGWVVKVVIKPKTLQK